VRGAPLSALVVIAAVLWALPAGAQEPVVIDVGDSDAVLAATGLSVAHDDDDDDENGVADAEQDEHVPMDDVRLLRIRGSENVEIRVSEGLRLLRDGRPTRSLTLPPRALPEVIGVQGLQPSARARDRSIVLSVRGTETRIPVTVVDVSFLDASNAPLDARRAAAGVSRVITNDASLARDFAYDSPSADPDNLRVEIRDPSADGLELRAVLTSGAPGGRPRSRRELILRRPDTRSPFRSTFVRLVGDVLDQEAPGVADRVLRVALRDVLQLDYETSDGTVSTSIRVGRSGRDDGPQAARRARLRVRVLRHRRGGVPAVGDNDQGAIRIAREQVRIANEIWVQCYLDFGAPGAADIEVIDPPPPALLAIGDGSALPARGGGVIRFRANGRLFRVTTSPGAPPVQTALTVAAALEAQGFAPEVTENPPTEFGAGRSADVLVRDTRGNLARLTPDRSAPLSTDARQNAAIGVVDLTDGLQEFDNMTAAAGTLEERALIKALADDDPTTIDLFIVNRFTAGTRQGEAFIEADGSAIINTLILDRNGIRQQREAWTQSHEIGHILLDMPFHPDNVGPDRPWLLMDADSSQGLVTGPKRITSDQCHRVRARSGVRAIPQLLRRHEEPGRPPEAASRNAR
jgi:hypothetical protein